MDKKDGKAADCYREKARNLIALDETVVKINKKAVYSAVDAERNELILMRVYTTRNWLITRSFVKEVLKYCEKKPKFVIDKTPWLIDALKSLNLEFEVSGEEAWLNLFSAHLSENLLLLHYCQKSR